MLMMKLMLVQSKDSGDSAADSNVTSLDGFVNHGTKVLK